MDKRKKQPSPAEIEAKLKELDSKIEEAEKNQGEVDIRDAIIEKGLYLKDEARYLDTAETVFRTAMEKTGGASKKMEILFEILQMSFVKLDVDKIQKDIEQCRELSKDGDWEKKNKLKVYEGVYCMLVRDFKRAADLFIDSVATFTCSELLEYKNFVFYTVVTSAVSQERPVIKKHILHSPDILSVIRDVPHLKKFSDSLYNCDYKSFFEAFVEISAAVKKDRYLQQHASYYVKEMRLVAYRQFLESYKSVTIGNMAVSFGVSPEFIDKELSHFISIGKLNCKIDKVSGVVISNRADQRVNLYTKMVKHGDLLLNRMQKLARALDI